jgi:DNA-binding FrmR family transcriptional regulator
MPYTPKEKSQAIARLRRIRGQAEALERAIEAGTECGPLLQQIVAMRGATNGLIAEVLESHLRVTFGRGNVPAKRRASGVDVDNEIDRVMKIFRTYLK